MYAVIHCLNWYMYKYILQYICTCTNLNSESLHTQDYILYGCEPVCMYVCMRLYMCTREGIVFVCKCAGVGVYVHECVIVYMYVWCVYECICVNTY